MAGAVALSEFDLVAIALVFLLAGLVKGVIGFGLPTVAIGLLTALGSSKLLEGLLFEVGRSDPLTLSAVGFFFGCVAIAASLVPAFRASRVNPMAVLREE